MKNFTADQFTCTHRSIKITSSVISTTIPEASQNSAHRVCLTFGSTDISKLPCCANSQQQISAKAAISGAQIFRGETRAEISATRGNQLHGCSKNDPW